MKSLILTLYSRTGCCLCEGLEQNLKSISLKDLTPPLELHVVVLARIIVKYNCSKKFLCRAFSCRIYSVVKGHTFPLLQYSRQYIKPFLRQKMLSNNHGL